jgi:LysR family transcriptional regulator, chromosome initiation inhibitor
MALRSIDPDALACLAAINDTGSFEGAATRLAVTQSAISQRLKQLENTVGHPLLVRSRPLALTSTGKLVLRYARQWEALQLDLSRELSDVDAPFEERVPIAVNADSLATWVMPALDSVVQRGIRLELTVDDQEFTHEWLKQGSVLGCVTTNPRAMQGCVAAPVGTMRYVAAAAPRFLAKHFKPGTHPSQLLKAPFVVFNRKDAMQRQWAMKALQLKRVQLIENFVPSSEAYVRAIQAGWGIGVAPESMLAPLFKTKLLQPVLPEVFLDINLYWHRWMIQSNTLELIGSALQLGAPRVAQSTNFQVL